MFSNAKKTARAFFKTQNGDQMNDLILDLIKNVCPNLVGLKPYKPRGFEIRMHLFLYRV